MWKSICTIDRVVGMMFNLPFGTIAYPFPMPQSVIYDGQVITRDWMCYLANIGTKIQEIDDAYLSQRPESELHEKVFKADQELRSLNNMTPTSWWTLTPESQLTDHILQYFYNYLTVRTHLQLALRDGTDSQYTYSRLACSQACRAVAVRYVKLRAILPPGFFAGRVLDLQALTATVYLLYNSQRPLAKQGLGVQNEGDQPASVLIEQVLQMMDTVSTQIVGGDFGRQGAAAIRALRELLNTGSQADTKNLTLRIPMLGKVNVNRHSQAAQNGQLPAQYGIGPKQYTSAQSIQLPLQYDQPGMQNTGFGMSGVNSTDLLSWSMDLMLDDFPPFPDDTLSSDQWMSFNGFNEQAQSWK